MDLKIQFINDRIVGIHVGGHLPFEIDITNHVLFDNENRLTVAVNNTMTSRTIPPGEFRYIQKQRGESKQYSEGFVILGKRFLSNVQLKLSIRK